MTARSDVRGDGDRPRSRVGEIVGGRYRIDALIERGGQGEVYRAFDLRDHDDVAIKVLAAHLSEDSVNRERMFREAKAMCLLNNSAAVRVLDQQWTQDGALCLVLELLKGKDLDDYLSELESQGGQMTPTELVELFEPLVDTLELAHENGIVHRDLKPGNVFVLDGTPHTVRLLDFGFAKFTRLPGLTRAGHIAGSPSYIAPETWRDRPPDRRVDVYALGALVFRALAGHPPFVAKHLAELLHMVSSGERPSLSALRPDLPARIDDWVAHALAIDPDERFDTVRALWTALTNVFERGTLGGVSR